MFNWVKPWSSKLWSYNKWTFSGFNSLKLETWEFRRARARPSELHWVKQILLGSIHQTPRSSKLGKFYLHNLRELRHFVYLDHIWPLGGGRKFLGGFYPRDEVWSNTFLNPSLTQIQIIAHTKIIRESFGDKGEETHLDAKETLGQLKVKGFISTTHNLCI